MLTIGITGGIGAGKSTVSKVIEAIGYPVFDSDKESKRLVDTDPEIRAELIAMFGEEIYQSDQLNRPLLAKHIFGNDNHRKTVNNIIHPKVREEFQSFCTKSNQPLIFNEAAILFETDAYKKFDKIILVTAPEELRIKRVIQRDNVNIDAVRSRIEKQWTDDRKIPLADYVIVNDAEKSLLTQVEEVISILEESLSV